MTQPMSPETRLKLHPAQAFWKDQFCSAKSSSFISDADFDVQGIVNMTAKAVSAVANV
jgi:hypothetical protein